MRTAIDAHGVEAQRVRVHPSGFTTTGDRDGSEFASRQRNLCMIFLNTNCTPPLLMFELGTLCVIFAGAPVEPLCLHRECLAARNVERHIHRDTHSSRLPTAIATRHHTRLDFQSDSFCYFAFLCYHPDNYYAKFSVCRVCECLPRRTPIYRQTLAPMSLSTIHPSHFSQASQ